MYAGEHKRGANQLAAGLHHVALGMRSSDAERRVVLR